MELSRTFSNGEGVSNCHKVEVEFNQDVMIQYEITKNSSVDFKEHCVNKEKRSRVWKS